MYVYIYIYTHMYMYTITYGKLCQSAAWQPLLHPAAVRCDMVLHQVFRARSVRKNDIGGEARHGVNYIGCFAR